MAGTEQHRRHSGGIAIAGVVEGMAHIFDIAGTMHPGNDQDPDPWIAARDDITEAWEEVGELFGRAIAAHSPRNEPIDSTPA